MSDEVNMEHFADMLEDNEQVVVPMLGIRLFVWLDANGEQMSHYVVEGSCRFDQIVGQVESMKQRMFFNQYDVVMDET
jgi:hypothetical protein